MEPILVIGSINMDLVVGVERFPNPGETLTGTRFSTVPGGKGANQAMALAKLGVPVSMAGRVGQDGFGDEYLQHFAGAGVDAALVERSDQPTGVALIEVDASGENRIVVAPGANRDANGAWIRGLLPRIAKSSIVLMQLEIPMEAVLLAAREVHRNGGLLVLDPAPMQPMPEELLSLAAVLTPNEHELKALTPDLAADAPAEERLRALMARGAGCVLHKRGAHGAYLCTDGQIEHIPAYRVTAVDTTAAGDSFNAGLAAGLYQGLSLNEAAKLACAVGALSTTRFGAQAGMPSMDEVRDLMRA